MSKKKEKASLLITEEVFDVYMMGLKKYIGECDLESLTIDDVDQIEKIRDLFGFAEQLAFQVNKTYEDFGILTTNKPIKVVPVCPTLHDEEE